MDKIFTTLRQWLASLLEVECPPDPLSRMTPTELADLPIMHPARDTGCA